MQQRVREKQQKLSEKAEKERTKLEELINSILKDGLFEDRRECEPLLNSRSKTRATLILKNQINFRKKILAQDVGKHALSKCSVEELKDILFSASGPMDMEFSRNVKEPGNIINRPFAHKWEEEGREHWYNGTVMSLKDGEFELLYQGNNELFIMTVAEFLTDVHLGDICYT